MSAPRFFSRWPRRTVRLRLTLVYGLLFLVSGAGLLAVTYVLVQGSNDGTVVQTKNGATIVFDGRGGSPGSVGGPADFEGNIVSGTFGTQAPTAAPPTPEEARKQAEDLRRVAAAQHRHEMHQLLANSAMALGGMAVVSIALGWWVAGRVLRPLRTMTATARELSEHRLDRRLDASGPDDEMRDLADTVNNLLARLETAFDAQRRFVANASHELRTPLTVERTTLEVALSDPDADASSLRRACERVLSTGEQQERLIEALLTLARSERGLESREPTDLAAIAAKVLDDQQERLRTLDVRVSRGVTDAPVDGNPALLERLVANLVDNAVRHNVPGGTVDVRVGTHDGAAVIAVANSGEALDRADVVRMFEPFQRLGKERTATDGHGLGLSIVAAIAKAHGGRVEAQARDEGGVIVAVTLPPVHSTDRVMARSRALTTV